MNFGIKDVRCLCYWLLLHFSATFVLCDTRGKVSFTVKTKGDLLEFVCQVDNLSHGLTFTNPRGIDRGHCTAPIPNTTHGHCSLHMKQNIFDETTTLMVEREDCETGTWKCTHGKNIGQFATTSVPESYCTKQHKPKETMKEVFKQNSLGSVTFDGRKSGNTVIFNCSFGVVPPSTNIEFFVDSVLVNDIRLYNGECYLTHTGSTCNMNQCQCSKDGKRYYWVYEEPKETFTATCEARFSATCSVAASIQFTASNLSPHENRVISCLTSSAMSYVRGYTLYIVTCIVLLISVILGLLK